VFNLGALWAILKLVAGIAWLAMKLAAMLRACPSVMGPAQALPPVKAAHATIIIKANNLFIALFFINDN
jgi:hypothetical protein